MSQRRDAPAFQEYAANMLANRNFRTMTLQERGLLSTLRYECWVNRSIPNDHNALAKMLGLQVAEIVGLIPAVMPFFQVVGTDITCPELDDYRAHLEARREKQSRGGKQGSAMTNGRRNNSEKAVDKGSSSTSSSNSQVARRATRRGRVDSLVQSSTEKQSLNQPLGSGVINDPFIAEYESAEGCTAEGYAEASGA